MLTKSDSVAFDFQDILKNQTKPIEESTSHFDCLDHEFFQTEIAKLIALRNEIE